MLSACASFSLPPLSRRGGCVSKPPHVLTVKVCFGDFASVCVVVNKFVFLFFFLRAGEKLCCDLLMSRASKVCVTLWCQKRTVLNLVGSISDYIFLGVGCKQS